MKKFLILALSAALLLALFGCGSPKEDDKGPPAEIGDLEEIPLTIPDKGPKIDSKITRENNSYMYKFTGDEFEKIKGALPGSKLSITYKFNETYAAGEVGWIDTNNAGPVFSGNGGKNTVYYDIEDLVYEGDTFNLHIFNGAELLEVTLYAAPPDYDVKKNELATEGAIKIVLPQGHKIQGRGDLSKADFKKITAAAGKTVWFYFDDKADTESGILKFGPKSYYPPDNDYKHYGINQDTADGIIGLDDKHGWRHAELTDNEKIRTIKYTVADINAAIAAATTDYGKTTALFNKLEINNDASDKQGKLLYIEVKQ